MENWVIYLNRQIIMTSTKFESFMLDNSTDIEKSFKIKSKISEYTSSNHYEKLFEILKN